MEGRHIGKHLVEGPNLLGNVNLTFQNITQNITVVEIT